jgi:exosome complex exonuclease DIS3/RRP44
MAATLVGTRKDIFVRKTKAGKVISVTREHYLRSDILCGSVLCDECSHISGQAKLSADTNEYIILDTNVILHQMDLLEQHAKLFRNIIFLQTVVEAVRQKMYKMYRRMRAFIRASSSTYVFYNEHHREAYVERKQGESANDHTDRSIRAATQWYGRHLRGVEVVLVTNDSDSQRKALDGGLRAYTLAEYLTSLTRAGALTEEENKQILQQLNDNNSLDSAPDGKGKWSYTRYLPRDAIESGLADGSLLKGVFQIDRDYWGQGSVTVQSQGRVLIPDMKSMNRAIDGDEVS